jgi:hypothetical protein
MRTTIMNTLVAILMTGAIAGAETSTVNSTNKWAWSSGAGWLNCRTDSTNGTVIGEYYCSGYFYSPSVGWISLGKGSPTNGVRYTNATSNDYGVTHDGIGHLGGYAWCSSVGWINFGWTNNPDATNAPKVDLRTGILTGFAWGGSLGWISLSNATAWLQSDSMSIGSDGNSNGLADSWEMTYFGGTNKPNAGPTNDYDGDGVNNSNEYIAGTSPVNAADFFVLDDLVLSGTNIQLTWPSKLVRTYRVERKTNLLETSWTSLGTYTADTDTVTIKLFPDTTQGFFRVGAIYPLSD